MHEPTTASVGTRLKRRDNTEYPDQMNAHARARQVARQVGGIEARALAECQDDDPTEPQHRADDMVPAQLLTRQKRGEQHDEQGPEKCDQARLGRRRHAQRRKIDGVIAKKAAYAEQPHWQGLDEGTEGAWPEQPGDKPQGSANGESHSEKLEGRNRTGGGRQQGEGRPHADGDEANRGGKGMVRHMEAPG